MKWLSFLRQYGPVSRNDNMYDETIQRSAYRAGVCPIHFEHPLEDIVLSCFDERMADPVSVILTGTAGDGKTHLCRQVWDKLGGERDGWSTDNPYLKIRSDYPADRKLSLEVPRKELLRSVTIHIIRDLSGWAPQQGLDWDSHKSELLQKLCKSLIDPSTDDIFLIAANDGQLVETWRRLPDSPEVIQARNIIEEMLVEDRQQESGIRLRIFNLSRGSSAQLFDRAYDAFVGHPGWQDCYTGVCGENDAFGPKCPIRYNYELLKTPIVRARLRALIELCDHNGLHLPIRQILLLLSNAVLGHPDCKDHLMRPGDIPLILRNESASKASIYNNIFGGNLSENRRAAITVFDYLERFQIGYETSNRIDNILIFGDGDERLGAYFENLVKNDPFYGADNKYFESRARYIEGADDDPAEASEFLSLLVAQRRGLFFKIPNELMAELKLWDLTVFRFAGEYLSDVIDVLKDGGGVRRPILSRLIKGLNRIFTGMLLNSERELFLATSGNYSQSKISRILVDRISVEPRHGEKVSISLDANGRIAFTVHIAADIIESIELNLVRYEFLSRVATEGALPASFSKECYEDMLAFKSSLLSAVEERRQRDDAGTGDAKPFLRVINSSPQGQPEERVVEVIL